MPRDCAVCKERPGGDNGLRFPFRRELCHADGAFGWRRRQRRSAAPCRAYARSQLRFTLASGLSTRRCALLTLTRRAHAALSSGPSGAGLSDAGLRLSLSVLVLGVPAWLLGGALPAGARALERDDAGSRATLARGFAWSMLGAALGIAAVSISLRAALGERRTFWSAWCAGALGWAAAAALAGRASKQPAQGAHTSWCGSMNATTGARL